MALRLVTKACSFKLVVGRVDLDLQLQDCIQCREAVRLVLAACICVIETRTAYDVHHTNRLRFFSLHITPITAIYESTAAFHQAKLEHAQRATALVLHPM